MNEFRISFLYEFKLAHNAVEAYRNIRLAFGENSIDERNCLVVVSKIQHPIAKKSIKKQIALINRYGSILLHLFRHLHLF